MIPEPDPLGIASGIDTAVHGAQSAPQAGCERANGGTAGLPSARQALDLALVRMASWGERPRCGEPSTTGNLWLSDEAEDRASAAQLCTGCPVLWRCRDAADDAGERFGVFGGEDRGALTRRRSRASTIHATQERSK